MDLSVIIVNYNTPELTCNAINSVLESKTAKSIEIILIDNNSKDNSVSTFKRLYPNITLLVNKANLGFSKANNQGIQCSKGRYVLLLNSDTEMQKDTIDIMIDYMDSHTDVGASGCKVVLPDGQLDKACKRGFPTPSASFFYLTGLSKLFSTIPRFNQYHLSHLNSDESHEIDCLVGAFMLVRRQVIEEVGLLDEDFFMYGEDIDWCYRIKKAGWKVMYYPKTTIIHFKGGSSRTKPFKIVYEFHRAMALFHRKHFDNHYSLIVNGLVYTGIGLKFIFSMIKNNVLKFR